MAIGCPPHRVFSVQSAASGREDTWTPVSRAAASFLGQAGHLIGLTGLNARGNLAQVGFRPSLIGYGKRGALVERFSASLNMDLLWAYRDLFDGKKSLERKFHPGTSWTLRGGWTIGLSVLLENFSVDRSLYQDYAVAVPRAGGAVDTIPFPSRALPDLPNYDLSVSFDTDRRSDLRDDGRTNAPILIRDPGDGIYKRSLATATTSNRLRVDWLFSYQPTPGTVFFAGYGSRLDELDAFAFRRLTRLADGFFTKFSYLFRL